MSELPWAFIDGHDPARGVIRDQCLTAAVGEMGARTSCWRPSCALSIDVAFGMAETVCWPGQPRVVIEDDVRVWSGFRETALALLEMAGVRDDIGPVSLAGHPPANLAWQREREGMLTPLRRPWGLLWPANALARVHPHLTAFMLLAERMDVRSGAGVEAAADWAAQRGARWQPGQGWALARRIACAVEGLAMLSTATTHCWHLGRSGVSWTPERYAAERLDETECWPTAARVLPMLSSAAVAAIVERERAALLTGTSTNARLSAPSQYSSV